MNLQIPLPAVVIVLSILTIALALGIFIHNTCNIDRTLVTKHNIEIVTNNMAKFLAKFYKCKADKSKNEMETNLFHDVLLSVESIRLLNDRDVYFFILNNKGQPIANGGNPDLCYDEKGQRPKEVSTKVAQDLVKIALEGGGFSEYMWQKPSTHTKHKKIAYVTPIHHTPWILGAGFYLEKK